MAKTTPLRNWRACYDLLHKALINAQAQRGQRNYVAPDGHPAWMAYEREVMRSEVNRLRVEHGLTLVDEATIRDAEQSASGHFDYTSKFAIYCADLAVRGA